MTSPGGGASPGEEGGPGLGRGREGAGGRGRCDGRGLASQVWPVVGRGPGGGWHFLQLEDPEPGWVQIDLLAALSITGKKNPEKIQRLIDRRMQK